MIENAIAISGAAHNALRVTRTYRWPVGLTQTRSDSVRAADTALVAVVTTLSVVAGERFARVTVEFDNPVRDHRVRTVARITAARRPRPAAIIQSVCDSDTIRTEPAFFVMPQMRMNVRA